MTQEPVHDEHEEHEGDLDLVTRADPGRRRARPRRGRGLTGCLTMVVVLGLIVFGLYVGLTKGVSFVKDQFADPEDYAGPGSGAVTVEVKSGETASDIAQTLEKADVVASAAAFTDAAAGW